MTRDMGPQRRKSSTIFSYDRKPLRIQSHLETGMLQVFGSFHNILAKITVKAAPIFSPWRAFQCGDQFVVTAAPVYRRSEIRLVRPRHCGVLSRVPPDVFGANRFRPVAAAAPISHGRGPRRREGALIVDRELELQVLAPVAWRWLGAPILPYIPFPSLFCGLVIGGAI